jgi:ornithine decarboxylase
VIDNFFREHQPATPCLILDLNKAKSNFETLQNLMPNAKIYYAIKANPHEKILKCFIQQGSCFDAASINEIELILSLGASADQICYGNVAKKTTDIQAAFALGVKRFVIDSHEELEKMAQYAPQSLIYVRINTSGKNAVWPLSQKFGCSVETAIELMINAKDKNLTPFGIAFHVGSQQLNPYDWEAPIRDAAEIFQALKARDIELQSLDLGGGFPIPYHEEVPDIQVFTQTIQQLLNHHFPQTMPEIVLEPGRYLVGSAGTLFTEVVLATTKRAQGEEKRWVYMDTGVFGGLAEASDQMIQYHISSARSGELVATTLAGPTCDSMDVMYKKDKIQLPKDLKSGDVLSFHHAGAYTTTYASIGFNGFAPLNVYCLGEI